MLYFPKANDHAKHTTRKLYIEFMKIIISLFFAMIFCANSFAQRGKVDFIAFGNNAYYNILERNNDVLLEKYYIANSRLKRDSLFYLSLESAKNELNFEILIKANRLQKEKAFTKKEFPYLRNRKTNFGELANKEMATKFSKFNRVASLEYPSKKDTIYSIKFYENGDKSLWYLASDDSAPIYERFWCKPQNQPNFTPVKNKNFDVFLMQIDQKLSVVYFDKKKGLESILGSMKLAMPELVL